MKTASPRASRLHSEGMNAESNTTKSRFDERADFSAQIASLPFIRNHAFARNSTKGFIFKTFRVFSSRLHGRMKKETVNLSLKNANLCLGGCFGTFHTHKPLCGESLFFDYSEGDIGG